MHLAPKGIVLKRFEIPEYERVCLEQLISNRFTSRFVEHLNLFKSDVKYRFKPGDVICYFRDSLYFLHALF